MISTATIHNPKFTTAVGSPDLLEVESVDLAKTITADNFFYFCQQHSDLRIEKDKFGEMSVMSPTGSETGGINFRLAVEFGIWVRQDGSGKGFDSSTGFLLPNGAIRSPDLAWIKLEKWQAIPVEDRKKFAPICPDFVVEIRSEADAILKLQSKMTEYIENGASLAWLIDVGESKVYVYQPETAVQVFDHPQQISGEPLLTGFVLEIDDILVDSK